MSVTNLESLSVSDLSPDRFPMAGAGQILIDGPVARTYLQTPLVTGDNGGISQGVLVTGDSAGPFHNPLITGDSAGPYGQSQIVNLSLSGVTAGNSANGALSWAILDESPHRFYVYDGATAVAVGDIDTGSLPVTVELSQANASGIRGSVTLMSAEVADDDENQKALFPLSFTVPHLSGDIASENILSMALYGVTQQNSELGALAWKYEHVAGDVDYLFLSIENYSGLVARASLPLEGEPSFPIEVPLEEQNGSGISGTVLLAGLAGLESGPAEEGRLIVLVSGAQAQISEISLAGVTTGNSEGGILAWEVMFDDGVVFHILDGETLVAQAQLDNDPLSYPLTVDIEECGSSGISGSATFLSGNLASLENQHILVPLSTSVPLLDGDAQAENIGSLTLSGVTTQNSQNGVLSWTYRLRDGGEGEFLSFKLHDNVSLVASATYYLYGEPYFPIEIPLQGENGSGISGTLVLTGYAGVDEGAPEQGRLIIQAARNQAQIREVGLIGVTDGNSDGGTLTWKLFHDEDLTFALFNGTTEIARGAGSEEFASFPLELELEQSNTSGVSGRVVLLSGHDVIDTETQKVTVPLSPVDTLILGDEEAQNLVSVTLHNVTPQTSRNGILSWTYELQETGQGDGFLFFTVHGPTGRVAAAEYPLYGEPYFPLEVPILESNGSGVSGSLILAGDEGLSSAPQNGHLLMMLLHGVKTDGDTTVTDKFTAQSIRSEGNVSGHDVFSQWNFHVKSLANEQLLLLSADEAGKWLTVIPPAQQIYVQHSETITDPIDDYSAPIFNVPLFQPLVGPETGSKLLPEAWWTDGKRLSINMTLTWFAGAYGEVSLVLSFESGEGYELTNLFGLNFSGGGGGDSGEAIIEIELMTAKVEGGPDAFNLRGYYKLNNEAHPLILSGLPARDYAFTAFAEFSEEDAATNYVVLRTVSIVASEAPRDGGLLP